MPRDETNGGDPAFRQLLPSRRAQVIRKLEYFAGGDATKPPTKIFIGAGYVNAPPPEGGRVIECFLRPGSKSGSELEFLLDDAAVMISLCLQCGYTPAAIEKHLGFSAGEPDRPLSLVSAAVKELVEIDRSVKEAWLGK